MKFVLSRKDKKRDDMKNLSVLLEKTKKNTHTRKDNYAMMSQGCLN